MTAQSEQASPRPADLFAGRSEVRDLLRACDWSQTPLGPPEIWPLSLRAVVSAMLTSRFAIWMAWGPALTFLCNDAYLPTVGLKRDWVIGSRSDKVWAEIWPDIGPRIERVLRTGEATWDEALRLYLERSGFLEETYHTFSYSPLADDEGEVRGMFCVVAEVTEKVIGERQLAALRDLGARLAAASSRSEVMTALEAALAADSRDLPFALAYLVDNGGDEARLAARHGLNAGEAGAPRAIGMNHPGADWPLGEAKSGRVFTVDIPAEVAAQLPLDHWQDKPTRALIAPLRRDEGTAPVGYLVAACNPHRALDAGYLGFIELLTAQVAAAVARADAYERERERAEALVEIDRAKTIFFSNVSHEFRTPLTLMLGPLEDALGEALPEPQRARVEIAHRNGLRLLRLVNALLEFSRIEAGRVEVSYQATDLAALTAELASSFRSATDRAGLGLVVDAPALPEPVYVDRGMWEKVVLNLMSNAFKFTFEGEIAVRVRAEDGRACVSVGDTGTGIPANELPRLFDRFHRVEGAKGRSFEGTGIGLALVQELVRLHGGEIGVESEWGKGSTFTVRLPFGVHHLPADRVAASQDLAPLGEVSRHFAEEALLWLPDVAAPPVPIVAPPLAGRPRVLLADDNADLRNYIARLLAERGYEVEAAADGAAALEAARNTRPDLVVTDVMMPRLDGFGLLRALREDPELRDLPVVMLSARAGEEAKIEGLDAGADDYLVKPFSARELLARVGANIAMAKVRREAMEAVRRSDAEAQAQAERVQLALEAGAIIGTWMWDVPRDRVIGDERFARVFGVSGEALEAGLSHQAMLAAMHDEDRPRVLAATNAAIARGGPFRCEYRVRDGRGGYRWIEANGRVDLDAAGVAQRFPGVVLDIDHRRRIEEELRGLNEELEARVAQAIAEREEAESALRQAQKMEAVGQLTGGIAHDFNNLLTIIGGNVESALRALDAGRPARAAGALANARKGAERAAALTQRLLAFARRQPLAAQPSDVEKLLSGMGDLLARSLGETVRLRIDAPAGLKRIEVDPNQFENALLNLAVNARDAMPEGGTLAIHAANVEADLEGVRDCVRLTVSDTGEGMSAATLARAFDPFFTTKEAGKGTGLGLSMVYGFVKQSRGQIKIDSQPGAGTTVTMLFPALAGDASAQEADGGATPALAPGHSSILLVEDDDDVREYTTGVLRDMGFRVIAANNGASALEVIVSRSTPVDLLLTDVVMPGMSGPELVERAQAARTDLKVLYASGYTPDSMTLRDRRAAGALLIAKPFTYQELAQKIAQAMGERTA